MEKGTVIIVNRQGKRIDLESDIVSFTKAEDIDRTEVATPSFITSMMIGLSSYGDVFHSQR